MIRRARFTDDLLRESDDALRVVVGLLDDVAPTPRPGPSSALDLHLALGLLDQIYAVESGRERGDAGGLHQALRIERDRLAESTDPGVR